MTAAQPTPGLVAGEQGAPALRIAGLTKSFGDTAAVSDVELTVGSGSFLGLVGPNGAGKTTLLSMAIGLLQPDRGTAFVLGQDVWSKAGSAKAKGPGARGSVGGAGSGKNGWAAASGTVIQGFSANGRQQTKLSRPPCFSPLRMLPKAAVGASKNITPKREKTAS